MEYFTHFLLHYRIPSILCQMTVTGLGYTTVEIGRLARTIHGVAGILTY